MDPWPGTTVLSLHEPDPAAIVFASAEEAAAHKTARKADYTPCAFACVDTPGTESNTMRCVAPTAARTA